MKNTTAMRSGRERMTIEEAACLMAERPLYKTGVCYKSPFPTLVQEIDPIVKRWVGRIRQATQDNSLSHCRAPGNDRGQVLYREADLIAWAERLFPRRAASNV